ILATYEHPDPVRGYYGQQARGRVHHGDRAGQPRQPARRSPVGSRPVPAHPPLEWSVSWGGGSVTVAFTTLPGLPASVAAARRFVTGVLHACPETTAPDEVVDRAALLTSTT